MLSVPFVLTVLLGVLLATPYVAFSRRSGAWSRVFGLGLVVAAAIYVVLALLRSGEPRDILLELGGLALFGAAALVGARGLPLLLAAGWVAHVAWDLLLHPVEVSGYAPWWYPVLCIGFDLFVAGFIVATCWGRRALPRSGREGEPAVE